MMNRVPMTLRGEQLLREELKKLKTIDRPRIIDAIVEARAHGDLKENAEYHAAREQQSFIEGRIKEIEIKLANVQIIDVKQIEKTGRVIFGTTVTLENIKNQVKIIYQIVGEDEADINEKRISVASPIARSIIGKYEGDTVEVNTPDGPVNYEIIEVEHI